jgi:hypothetical protein
MRIFKAVLQWRSPLLIALSLLLASNVAWADSESKHKQFTTDFDLAACTFSVTGGNAYFSLDPAPGPMNPILLEGEEGKELVQVQIAVSDDTMEIDLEDLGLGKVMTRVVEETEWIDFELVEESRNFFARCEETDAVYYFGEEVTIYEDGEVITGAEAGSWLAGTPAEDGESINMPGLIMPGTFLLGSRYYQEVAPEVALDRAEHIEMGLTVETPAGIFNNSVKTLETSPLEPSAKDIKIYAPGAGLIVDGTIERVNVFSTP